MKFLLLNTNQSVDTPHMAFSVDVAKRTGSSVTMFVVTKEAIPPEESKEYITDVEKRFLDIPHEMKFVAGDPLQLTLNEIETEDYDMVIMGIRQRRRVVPSAYRVLSQKIIKNSPIPVMLVREANLKLERILICTGGQDISEPVVKLSANLAGTASLQATLLYVTGAVPSMYTGMVEMEESLEKLLERDTPLANHLRTSAEMLAQNNVEAEVELRRGDVAEAILQEAEEGDYDLIVLGTSGSNSFAGFLLSNVTQQIINHACCAVLIVK
jgi:nucleotide-binding universal stress UspA family protein